MCIRDRNKNGSFCCLADLESFSPAELIALIRELQRQIEELRRENEELRRRQGRSAAPFSKGAGKENPKPPGRKAGEGVFLRREDPVGENGETISVAVEAECCPDCGGALEPGWTETASITDLVEMPLRAMRTQGGGPTRGPCGRSMRRDSAPSGAAGKSSGACAALQCRGAGQESPGDSEGADRDSGDAECADSRCPETIGSNDRPDV